MASTPLSRDSSARVITLLTEGIPLVGRKLLQVKLITHNYPSFKQLLSAYRKTFDKLKKNSTINQRQYDMLFPLSGVFDINNLDVTLLLLVLTKSTSLSSDEEDFINDAKSMRNELHGHISKNSLPESEFNRQWSDISDLLAKGALLIKDTLFQNEMQQFIDKSRTESFGGDDVFQVFLEWCTQQHGLKEALINVNTHIDEKVDEMKVSDEPSRLISDNALWYVRLMFIIVELGKEALQGVFLQIVNKSCGNEHEFIRKLNHHIVVLEDNNVISPSQSKKLKEEQDICEWDYSLLKCLLINCCTLKGKCMKLEVIVELEAEAHGDLHDFLESKRNILGQLKDSGHLTIQQYNQIFNGNDNTLNQVHIWETPSLMCVLLNLCKNKNDIFKTAFVDIINLEIEMFHAGSLDTFINTNEDALNAMLESNELRHYKDVIFPPEGSVPSLLGWDVALLSSVILTCLQSMPVESVAAVEKISFLIETVSRKEIKKVTARDFQDHCSQFEQAVDCLIECSAIENNIKKTIEYVNSKRLRDPKIVKELKEWYWNANIAGEMDMIREVRKTRSHLNAEMQKERQIEDLQKRVRRLEKIENEDQSKIPYEFSAEMFVHCLKPEDKKKIEAVIVKEGNACLGKKEDSGKSSPFMESVTEIQENLQSCDTKLKKFELHCIALHLICNSTKGLSKILEETTKTEMQIVMNRIAVKIDQKFGIAVELRFEVNLDHVEKAITAIEKKHSNVTLKLTCTSAEGLIELLNKETTGESGVCDRLSYDLSTQFQQDVRITNQLDLKSIENTIIQKEQNCQLCPDVTEEDTHSNGFYSSVHQSLTNVDGNRTFDTQSNTVTTVHQMELETAKKQTVTGDNGAGPLEQKVLSIVKTRDTKDSDIEATDIEVTGDMSVRPKEQKMLGERYVTARDTTYANESTDTEGTLKTSDMDEEYRSVSLKLYDVMDQVGVSEKIRKLYQETAIAREIIWTIDCQIFDLAVTNYIFGSDCEGTTTLGLNSDVDIVACNNSSPVIDDIAVAPRGFSYLMIRDDTTYPGYVKLQCVRDGIPMTIYNTELPVQYDTDTKGRICLKHVTQKTNRVRERHGPADTEPKNEHAGSKDMVFALKCMTIPIFARSWLDRQRVYNWPSRQQLQEMGELGCFVVGVGHCASREPEIEWRVSFSLQERLLMFSLNPTQHKCYVLLKMIKKDIICTEIGECISSYHCKTCLYYAIENTQADIWRPGKLVKCIRLCLIILFDLIVKGVCPNYFVSTENMFEKPQFRANKDRLLQLLRRLLAKGYSFVLDLQCDDIRTRMLQPQIVTNHISDQIVYHRSLTLFNRINKLSFNMYILTQDSLDNCKRVILLSQHVGHLTNTRLLDEHTEQQTRDAISYVIPVLHLHIAQRLVSIAFSRQGCKNARLLLRLSFHHFNKGNHADLITSRIMVASLLLRLDKYELCEMLLKDIEDDITKHIVTQCICCDRSSVGNKDLQFIRQNEVSYRTAVRTMFVSRVRFLRCDTEIAPLPLQYEMYRSIATPRGSREDDDDSWFDWAAVDGKVYLYFLQYLVYSRLNRPANKHVAIDNLLWVLGDDPNLYHTETAYNLLGWIYVQEGLIPEALQCFVTSWRIRPDHNAAKFHVLNLYEDMTRLDPK